MLIITLYFIVYVNKGVNWFKRQYATSLTTWRYEQTIIWKNGGYQVSGIKGPLREVFSYKLTPDNRTVEMINIGEIGGQKSTTATVVGSSLISYLADPTSGVVDMIAERSLAPGKNEHQIETTTNTLLRHIETVLRHYKYSTETHVDITETLLKHY